MKSRIRIGLLALVILLFPIITFVLWGEQIETAITTWLTPPPAPQIIIAATVAVLAADIFLPVPSSFVSTLAATQLPLLWAVVTSWIGLNVGALLGFGLARLLGKPIVRRLTKPNELQRMELLCERYGSRVLVICRALPVFAEASVLFFGAAQLSWRSFLLPVVLSNLGIAIACSLLGYYGREQESLYWVLLASIVLPLLATAIVHWKTPLPKQVG